MSSFFRNSRCNGSSTIVAILAIAALFTFIACGGGSDPPGTTTPTVTSTTPTDGAPDIPLDTDITITFSEAMNKTSVMDSLLISPNPGSYASTWSGNVLTINPDSDLAESTLYTFTLGGSTLDAEGTAMGTEDSFSFTTAVVRPIVVSTIPANGATTVATTTDITITFSKTMSQSITEDAISIAGYTGSETYNWTSGSVVEISLSPILTVDSTYTVSIGAYAEDSGGTSMGTSYNFTFSTGTIITGVVVSGTIFDDPDSTHDDDLTGAYVVLKSGPPWDADDEYFFNTGSNGIYQFDYVEDGSYYPVALLDTNDEDGGPDPNFGDAVGEYLGMPATVLTVTGSDRTGIDIQLVDPEAISGEVFYSGIYSSHVFSLNKEYMNLLQVYAFESTTGVMYEAELTMASSGEGPGLYTVAEEYGGEGYGGAEWVYGLNPFLMPELSVSGNFADGTVTQTADEYIPPGDYQVLGYMDVPVYADTQDPVIAGFADNLAAIDDTGDDAGGVNITLYDTIEIGGNVAIISFDDDVDSTTAIVKILGWPLFAPVSNQVIGSDSAVWIYPAAPVGLPVALHGEPDPADAWTLMAVNRQYSILDTSDAWPNEFFEQRVIQRDTMDALNAMAGTTIDPTKAQILGSVLSSAWSDTWDGHLPITGVTVTISTGDQVQYMYSDMSFGAPFTQAYADPQFAIFNVDPFIGISLTEEESFMDLYSLVLLSMVICISSP